MTQNVRSAIELTPAMINAAARVLEKEATCLADGWITPTELAMRALHAALLLNPEYAENSYISLMLT